MKFILRWIATAVAIAAAVWLIPGIAVTAPDGGESWVAIFLTALALAAIDSSIKPVLRILSLPITIITLGIFALVLNTLLLYLASWLVGGLFQVDFEIASFGSAFMAAIVISIVSAIMNSITGANE